MNKTDIVTFLDECGCPTHYNGYMELVDLLDIAASVTGCVSKNLKIIYHDTAKKTGTTRLCLERNLRTLALAWSKKPAFGKLFNEIPTNAEFIIRLANITRGVHAHDEVSAFDLLLS